MPDNEDSEKTREFMREKIVKQPLSGREIAKRLLIYVCLAALFGVIASFGFVLAKPLADRYLGTEETEESSSVRFTKDEPDSSAAESLPETTAAESDSEEEEERIQKSVEEAVKKFTMTPEHVSAMYATIRETYQQADKGIVTVRSGKQQADLFGNPIENTGDYAGAVIAQTRGEYMIFTSAEAVREASSILVAFYDGTKVAGTVKQIDEVMDMAVVSVPVKDIPEQVRNATAVLELGNSYSVRVGDPMIAVGGPAGAVHSLSFGNVTYVARNVPVTDGQARILYADLESNSRVGTFLLNLSGQLIGWTSDAYHSEGGTARTMAVGISDYKAILEKMSNGISCAYFGVHGQDISESSEELGEMPRGVYATEVVSDSPAYNAGIQPGDVIIGFAGTETATCRELQTQIENASSGVPVYVKVMRRGRDGYTELNYTVDIRAR